MKAILTSLLAVLMVGCFIAAEERSERQAFKGIELYSWKPDGKDWHFSLLPGTNRLKSDEEIKKSEKTIVGVEALKKQLAKMAKGESVFWRNLSKENAPGDMVKDLKKFCAGIKVNLIQI